MSEHDRFWDEDRQREIVRLLEEIHDQLDLVDPAWPPERQRAERERLHAERVPLVEESAVPLLADLKAIGFDVEDVFFLASRPGDYDAAFPLLLDHLARTYPIQIRSGIARAFECRSAGPLWDELVVRYRREPHDLPFRALGVRMMLASAIAEACPAERLPDLLNILRDQSMGSDRVMFIGRLWRAKRGLYQDAMLALADDPELAKEIEAKHKGKAQRR